MNAVRQAVSVGRRLDGRLFDEFPPVEVNTGVFSQAAGSSHTRMGDAEVLVGVKVLHQIAFFLNLSLGYLL
jgi:exosome complex RNA-binding protein Rrp42 (RNase PH superfamily)